MISTLKCAGRSGTAGTVPPKCQVTPSPSVTVRPAISVHTVSVSAPTLPCPFFLHLADRPALLLPVLRLSLASFTCELAAAALAKAASTGSASRPPFPALVVCRPSALPAHAWSPSSSASGAPKRQRRLSGLVSRLAACGRVTDAFLPVPTGMSPLGSGVGLAVPQAPGSPSEVEGVTRTVSGTQVPSRREVTPAGPPLPPLHTCLQGQIQREKVL